MIFGSVLLISQLAVLGQLVLALGACVFVGLQTWQLLTRLTAFWQKTMWALLLVAGMLHIIAKAKGAIPSDESSSQGCAVAETYRADHQLLADNEQQLIDIAPLFRPIADAHRAYKSSASSMYESRTNMSYACLEVKHLPLNTWVHKPDTVDRILAAFNDSHHRCQEEKVQSRKSAAILLDRADDVRRRLEADHSRRQDEADQAAAESMAEVTAKSSEDTNVVGVGAQEPKDRAGEEDQWIRALDLASLENALDSLQRVGQNVQLEQEPNQRAQDLCLQEQKAELERFRQEASRSTGWLSGPWAREMEARKATWKCRVYY